MCYYYHIYCSTKKQLLRASVLLDKSVETFPHVWHQMKLDDLGRDSPTARINSRKMVQKKALGL